MTVRTAATPSGYTVRSELGTGRFGRTLLCRDDGSGREAVVRVLDAVPSGERERALVATELASAAAASRHPCAVAIDAVWDDERAGMCLRQPYLPGGSAQALLEAGSVWAVDDVVVLGLRAAAALTHAHRLGVLHLDVRPANLIADAEGAWYLADGGITHAVVGAGAASEPRYVAREMQGWESPGPACDVYALGATMNALLGGPAEMPGSDAHAGSPRAGLPTALAGLLARMTAADPAARPPLAEVDRVLRAAAGSAASGRAPRQELVAAPVPVPLPVRRLGTLVPAPADGGRDRRRRLIAAAVAIGVVFAAVAGLTVASLDGDDGSTEMVAGSPTAEPSGTAATGTAAGPVREAASASPVDPGAAPAVRPVPPSVLGPGLFRSANLKEYLPASTRFSIEDFGYMITWREPILKDDIVGYLVVLTPKSNPKAIQARQYAGPGELLAVFLSPPLKANSCFSVNPLIDDGKSVRVAVRPRECNPIKQAFAQKAAADRAAARAAKTQQR